MDGLGNMSEKDTPDLVVEKIASMSCKAAVKGNQKLSRPEIEHLIDELLTLENPYFCPHGRPVIVSTVSYTHLDVYKRQEQDRRDCLQPICWLSAVTVRRFMSGARR